MFTRKREMEGPNAMLKIGERERGRSCDGTEAIGVGASYPRSEEKGTQSGSSNEKRMRIVCHSFNSG